MGEVNVSQMLASRLRSAADQLERAIEKMPADKVVWEPEIGGFKGRSALDQVLECAYVNGWGASIFKDRNIPPFDSEDYQREVAKRSSAAEAVAWLTETTAALSAAIAAFPESQWATMTTNPFTQEPQSWAEQADLFYWNMVYHQGQINYIQTLYGDTTM